MEYKKCPFCGGEATLYQNYSRKYRTYFVLMKCEFCGSQGKSFSSENAPSDENWENDACRLAEKVWNTRTNN